MTQIPPPPFHPEMWQALVEGRKVTTARAKKLGEPGDRFEKDGAKFRIVEVDQEQFLYIRNNLYRLEGFASMGEFINFWIRIHRGHLPKDSDVKYVHYLARIP
jgi:hypothetical protein